MSSFSKELGGCADSPLNTLFSLFHAKTGKRRAVQGERKDETFVQLFSTFSSTVENTYKHLPDSL